MAGVRARRGSGLREKRDSLHIPTHHDDTPRNDSRCLHWGTVLGGALNRLHVLQILAVLAGTGYKPFLLSMWTANPTSACGPLTVLPVVVVVGRRGGPGGFGRLGRGESRCLSRSGGRFGSSWVISGIL